MTVEDHQKEQEEKHLENLKKQVEILKKQLEEIKNTIYHMDAFLRDFDLYFAMLFKGARHDSGDPFEWAEKLVTHYMRLGIDPKTKSAIFSDGLTFPKAFAINNIFGHLMSCSYGIGTNLTNDTPEKALQIVIKMTKCNGQPVAKIADSRGKQMCNDKEYLKRLASVFKIDRTDIFN